MDYDDAQAAFFAPRESQAVTLDWTSAGRRLRDAIEPLATVSFWARPAYDAYVEQGLDFLGGYIRSRASVLGDAEPAVVAAAFGVFAPGVVAEVYAAARETCSLAGIRAAREQGATRALREVLGDPADAEGLEETVAALRTAADAAPSAGRALFAGASGLVWPEDPWARLWHVCTLLREHRGDDHLAAVAAAGLDGLEAGILTERWLGWEPLAYTGTRAWSAEAMAAATASLEARGLVTSDTLTDAGRRLREEVETATDRAGQGLVAALPDDLDVHLERLHAWSDRVVQHGWFPPDPYKRAAG